MTVLLRLAVAVTAVGMVTTPVSADDDHDNVECTWRGTPSGYAYAIDPEAEVPHAAIIGAHRRAVTDTNEIMGGRVAIRENTPVGPGDTSTYGSDRQVWVYVENHGENQYAGWWSPWGGCRSTDGGPWYYTYGDVVYNSFYTDRRVPGKIDDPRYPSSVGYGPHLALHETFHTVGGDHLALNTPNPRSTCNVLYHLISPFIKGGDCEPMAGFAKPGDITHLQSLYPAPDAGGADLPRPPGLVIPPIPCLTCL
ncbi:MAG TPA: hypothetical protein VF230_10980 [Acidimicrobiales bacterium]